MYRVTVTARFSAAHRLRLADGRLEAPHGHDWVVEVSFAGPELDSTGVLIDFVEAKQALDHIVGQLHHTDLNQCPLMQDLNPSAEHVARIIFQAMETGVNRPKLLESVRVREQPGCWASFLRRTHHPA